jgi:hypothetical protein
MPSDAGEPPDTPLFPGAGALCCATTGIGGCASAGGASDAPPPQPAHINPRNKRIEIPRSIEVSPAVPALDVCMLRKKGGSQSCPPAVSSSTHLGAPSDLDHRHWSVPRGGTSLRSTPRHCRSCAASQACWVPRLHPPPRCPRSSSGPRQTAETTARPTEAWNPKGTGRCCHSRLRAPTRFQWEDAPPSTDKMHPPQTMKRPPQGGLPCGLQTAAPYQPLPGAHLARHAHLCSTPFGPTRPVERTAQRPPRTPRFDPSRTDPHQSCERAFRPARARCHEKKSLPVPQQHPVERLRTKRVGR